MDIVLLLEQAQRRVSRELDHALLEIGASTEQWRVLDKLADESGRPIGELASELRLNPPTMTKLIDRMVAGGLVQRIADEKDSRRVLVFITDSGLALFRKLSRRANTFQAELMESLSERGTSQLGKLLGQLAGRPN